MAASRLKRMIWSAFIGSECETLTWMGATTHAVIEPQLQLERLNALRDRIASAASPLIRGTNRRPISEAPSPHSLC